MFFYILLNIFIIIIFSLIWISVYKKYKKYNGLYFLLSILFLCFWIFLYLFIYWIIENKYILLYIFRFMYVMSFLSLYFMIGFIYFFWIKINKSHKKNIFIITSFIFSFFVFTPYIISDLKFIPDKWYYFETYGILYNIILFLYIIYIPLFLFISYFKIKTLVYINKIRLIFIISWYSIFILLWLLFYLILPYFWIFLFENAIFIFLTPFLFSILYSTNIYNFSNFKLKFSKIFISIISVFLSLFFLILFSKILKTLPWNNYLFWKINNLDFYLNIIFSIILYIFINNFLNKHFLWNNSIISFEKELNKLKNKIYFISTLDKLNIFLSKSFYILFKISNVNIKLFTDKSKKLEIYKYFTKNIFNNIFINDIVFIEENKHKFNIKKIKKEINKNIYLIFPLFDNKNKLIGIFQVWWKPFKDYFSREEIKILKDFTDFLIWHIKYIDIYSKINDLNINLDKKIDEKTIEYNNLINKQKEFISMSSHEIKTPIMWASLQIENIIDDIELWEYNEKTLKKELCLLKEQIFKVSDLVNIIFSIQKYDIKEHSLYIEHVNFKNIFLLEIDILEKTHPNIKIILNYDDNIWFIDIDKIQFTQVISNLLNNAVKFIKRKKPIIKITVKENKRWIYVIIEDNWVWIWNIKQKDLFKRYKTWDSKYFWLWMWLYLCHKIIKLHWWNIKASNSIKLKWAKFIIFLPKKNNN